MSITPDQVRDLMQAGHGDRFIAGHFGITRHAARNLMREAERAAEAGGPQSRFEIDVSACRPSRAARVVKPIHVETLARSITEIGLLQPISVRAVEGGFEVIAGLHRLRAFEQLGRAQIPAIVRHDDDLRAELALIDENLIRNELSPIERDIAIARRKAIYEALHPETRHGGDRKSSRQVGDSKPETERFSKATADATGQGERTVQRSVARVEAIGEENLARLVETPLNNGVELDALAKLEPQRRASVIERAVAGETVSAHTEFNRQKREHRIEEIAAAGPVADLPRDRTFNIFYADPPWRFDVWSEETGLQKSPENHYPTMTVEEICAMPVGDLVAEHALLYLWITAPRLFRAPDIFNAWGRTLVNDPVYGVIRQPWTYVTHYVWDKERIATGYWNRNRHEILLVARIGDMPRPFVSDLVASVHREASTVHSAKPDFFAELIERHYPTLPKLELFRRGAPRPGWLAWGNESPPPQQSPSAPDTPDNEEAA